MQDSKTQTLEVFHPLFLEKTEQHFAEQKHHRHLLTATFSVHNVLFTFVKVESEIPTKKRSSLSTASQQLQHHFREQLRVSTAEEEAEDPLHTAEALVKTKEDGRDEMRKQLVACRNHPPAWTGSGEEDYCDTPQKSWEERNESTEPTE
ncbi:hypothetical protein BLNAU_788 [Blattamonas nauphoetae]|uniref:Uncharacterized protein n=1 Tax=Blattamonas nauphoetae TaxID=2049346 RepID=A0ABQ9YKJ0_9EUKA|nr:hypothetical protein BLNAU_788 [Blattamonas nauphoetae]